MDFNPYQSPYPCPDSLVLVKRRDDIGFRLLAALLWVIALGWSLLCVLFIAQAPASVIVWAPGYLVMLGYCWRAFFDCPPRYVKLIWCWSLLVQGAWLVVFSLYSSYATGPDWLGWFYLFLLWWLISTLFSVGGVYGDGSWERE